MKTSRRFNYTLGLIAFAALVSGASFAAPAVPAFPGAEGAGAVTVGGRGGRVIPVTNLADSGPGSLRAALEAAGPRTVVFHVSGIITLESKLQVNHPFLTVAGQSAPGDGICVRGHTVELNASDVIIRYLRFRRGNLTDRDDALNARSSPGRIIIDHCSFSWGLDENVSIYRYMRRRPDGKEDKLPIEHVTIQWSISSEALNPFKHAFGATWGGRNVSFHHNLFASNTARNPSIGWGDHVDFRNNVLFNWQHRTIDGGDSTSLVNIVGNTFKPGPATERGELQYRIAKPEVFRTFNERPAPGQWYVAGNTVVGNSTVTADNWAGGVQFGRSNDARVRELIAQGRAAQPAPAVPISEHTAAEAYERVLARAGAVLPRRDPVDERIIREVRDGRPTFGDGIIKSPADVGGYPQYRGLPAPVDSDGDGMPDAWERRFQFDFHNPADGAADSDKDGYTNLEEYLNGTNPREFIDYKVPANNVNTLHR
jgi:pectate lyase